MSRINYNDVSATRQRIIDHLAANPRRTTKEIAAMLSRAPESIRSTINSMEKDGEIANEGTSLNLWVAKKNKTLSGIELAARAATKLSRKSSDLFQHRNRKGPNGGRVHMCGDIPAISTFRHEGQGSTLRTGSMQSSASAVLMSVGF